jgi:hypothetical protein
MTDDDTNKFKPKANEFKVLGVPWEKLPLAIRRIWWHETDYNRLPPAPEFRARLPQLLADAQARVANDKREIAADAPAQSSF